MNPRSFNLSLALHLLVLGGALFGDLLFVPDWSAVTVKATIVTMAPPPGGLQQKQSVINSVVARPVAILALPGNALNLADLELEINDDRIDGLPAVLKRFHGRITSCGSMDPDQTLRLWLYDSSAFPETLQSTDFVCADFPASFGNHIVARILEKARSLGIQPSIQKAVIGFVSGPEPRVEVIRVF